MHRSFASMISALIIGSIAFGNAHAQMSMPMTSPMGVDLMIESEDAKQDVKQNRKSQNQYQQRQPSPQQISSLKFVTSRERQRANWDALAAAVQKIDPNQGNAIRQLIAGADWNAKFGQAMRKHKLDPQNIADVFGIWLLNTWQTSRGNAEEITTADAQLVSQQFRRKFSNNQGILQLSDKEKQNLADHLILQIIAFSLATEGAKTQPSQWNAIKNSAKRNAIDVGVDLDTIEWNSTGFVSRKSKSCDAGEAIDAADPAKAGEHMAFARNGPVAGLSRST
jgi:hypothetical protein